MSADRDRPPPRHHHPPPHHYHHHPPPHHHVPPHLRHATYCICGAKMVQGRIQQGVAKCNNLNCQQILTGKLCYYCPNGGNVQRHKNGFFYCQKCANQLARGAQVVQAKPAVVQSNVSYSNPVQRKSKSPSVVKQGYMEKRGEWLSTSYKKRWFKLWSNKKMAYLTHPGASSTKGYCDFSKIKKMERKNKKEFEVTTSNRVWAFQCQNESECNEWFNTIQRVCTNVPVQQQAVQQPVASMQQQQQQQRQPPVQYVAAPQQPQQVQYVQQQPPPQGQVQYVQQPVPQQQPIQYVMAPQQQQQQSQQGMNGNYNYNNDNNGNGVKANNAVNGAYPNLSQPSGPSAMSAAPAPQQSSAAQNLQPGMAGYGMGNMYGNNGNGNMNENGNKGSNMNQWEDKAPPAAFAPSAPFEPSAPPMDEEEGSSTHQ